MTTKQNRLWGTGIILWGALAGLAYSVEPAAPAAQSKAMFDLFTDSEAAAWNSTAPKESTDFKTRDLSEDNATPTCRSTANNDADNPKIRILAPVLEKPLIAPIDIELQFIPVGSTHIRPETFRVCYLGMITMDITKRITDHVAISEQGLHVTGAQLPHGHHKLVMLIADQHGRLARQEAAFNVL
ncbi:MAG: hypothetical protein NVS9B2_24570 [Steroidobacteraceae bacterium]